MKDKQPVNRARRFQFVAATTAFCLITSSVFVFLAGIGYFAISIPLIEMFVKAMVSLATALVLAYITGSVVDYNGGVGNAVMGQKRETYSGAKG